MKLRFTLSKVGKSLPRNRVISVAAVLVTFVLLLFVGVADLSQMQVVRTKSEWYDRTEVSIYMCAINDGDPSCSGSEADTEQISQVRTKLKSSEMQSYVKEVYEESKEETCENLKRFYEDSAIGQWMSTDMMQASFRVRLVDPEQYSTIKEEFSGVTGMSEVKDQHEVTEPLFKVIDAARLLALGLSVATVVAATLLTSVTIRLSAMSREREAQIVRYVGASSLFIRTPFTIGGVLAAVMGTLLAVTSLFTFAVFLVQGRLQPIS